MTTCNKSLASFFFSLVLLCLCTCPAARAINTNVWGYYVLSYDELDELWGDYYESYTGQSWPGLQQWCNTLPEIANCFRSPHPYIIGRVASDVAFFSTNGFAFASLSPLRNYLCDTSGTLFYLDQEVPDYAMLQSADKYNLVDSVVESLVNVPNIATNDANFPWRVRLGQVDGMRSRVRGNVSALLCSGVSLEVKTVPYGWSGYWAGWSISVCELIDHGVDPSVFGALSYMCDEPSVVWISDTRSIFGAYSNISVKVTHRWRAPNE